MRWRRHLQVVRTRFWPTDQNDYEKKKKYWYDHAQLKTLCHPPLSQVYKKYN